MIRVIVLVGLAGCAAPATGVRTLTLYRSSRGGDHALALVRLGDREVPLMIDTGTRTHVVSAALAWYLGLPRTRTDLEVRDASSASVPILHVEGGLALPPLGTTELWSAAEPQLDAVGIAGVISPQALVRRDRTIVLDLAAGTLVETAAVPRIAAPLVGTPCTSTFGTVYLIDAKIGDHAARLEVDTGAPQTSLHADSAAGRALLATHADAIRQSELDRLLGRDVATDQPQTQTRAGFVGATHVIALPQLRVTAGTTTVPLDVDVTNGRDDACHSDGVLGLDFLSGWVLVLTPEGLAGHRDALQPARPLPASTPFAPIVLEGIDVSGACESTAPLAPVRYDDPLAGWELASEAVRSAGSAVAAVCERSGYLRANVSVDLTTPRDHRTFRGRVTVTPGRRYRNGRITVRARDGAPLPALVLDQLRADAWYAPSQLTEQSADLDRQLAPRGLHVVGTRSELRDADARIDVELVVGP